MASIATHRLLRCTLFGNGFDVPWPRDWESTSPEPIQLCDIEVTRESFRLFRMADGARYLFMETLDQSELWRECWDKKFKYPIDAKLSGVTGFRALYLLRLYEVGADDGASVQWHRALSEGDVGWRALENSRPDLLSVPLLQEWKRQREQSGEPINPRGRQYGSKVGNSNEFALDCVAIGEFEMAKKYGRPMTWKRAVAIACERFPDLLTGATGDTSENWQASMVHRLEKRQKPQARLREIRKRGGSPGVKK